MAAKTGRITILRTDNQYVPDSLGARYIPPGVNFRVKLIGKSSFSEPKETQQCQTEMLRLKVEVEQHRMMNKQYHKKRLIVNVSLEGVALIDPMTAEILHMHSVNFIMHVLPDASDNRAFGYLYGNENDGYTFFAFKTEKLAEHLMLTLKDLFQIVVNMRKRDATADSTGSLKVAAGKTTSPDNMSPNAPAQTQELVRVRENVNQMTAAVGNVTVQETISPTQNLFAQQQPVVQPPVAQQPIVQQPVAQQPVLQQPVAQQPIVQQSVSAIQLQPPPQQATRAVAQQQPEAIDPFGGALSDPWASQPAPQPQPQQPPPSMDPFGAPLLTPQVLGGGGQPPQQALDPFSQLINRPATTGGVPSTSAKQLFNDLHKKDQKSMIQLQQEKQGVVIPKQDSSPNKGNMLEALMQAIPEGKKSSTPTSSGLGVPVATDPLKTKTLEKISGMIEEFLGVGDSKLAEAIYDLGYIRDDPSEFAEQVASSDLGDFGFTETFIFDLWGAMEDVRAGRSKQ